MFLASANDGWKGDIANANASVTMIRDFIAGEDDFFLSLLDITYKAGVDLETSGDKTYLVYSDCETSTVLVEFTDTSDLTKFNKYEDTKEIGDL